MFDKFAVAAYPMHGQHKLSNEGYRTRDGHFIEWFGKLLQGQGAVAVLSRPEPRILSARQRYLAQTVAENTTPVDSRLWRIPRLRDPRFWWIDSLTGYRAAEKRGDPLPTITWNPFVALSNVWPRLANSNRPFVIDLLDDWTMHFAFESIRKEVVEAYKLAFDRATTVTANAEGTLELAHRFGRTDAVLLPNGCDPDRFSRQSSASGNTKIGYVGKIGRRLNLELITSTARALPQMTFVFAGPILDREYETPLRSVPNIKLLGDVRYEQVPELLTSFDIGWVPHFVGTGEVGGDVIKTYEYRAAGLPVLTTPVSGASNRGLEDVHVLPPSEHIEWLKRMTYSNPRVVRALSPIPNAATWKSKAEFLLNKLGLAAAPVIGPK